MLTDQELKNLQLLTLHSKYGFIVQKAIEVWSGEVSPSQHNWGIECKNDVWELVNKCCCLVGANLINKQELIKIYSADL